MKLNLSNNWIAKILSLLLATAIWFLIKDHLASGDGPTGKPPRATIVPEFPRSSPKLDEKR
jgi:YbbR domain-containing protein